MLTSGYQRGIRVVMLIKMVLFASFTVLSQFSFWHNLRASGKTMDCKKSAYVNKLTFSMSYPHYDDPELAAPLLGT